MKRTRIASGLLVFACVLILAGCQHNASSATAANQPAQAAGSQAQSSSASAQSASPQAQPADANVPPAPAGSAGTTAANSQSAPPAAASGTAPPAQNTAPTQGGQTDQAAQASQTAQAAAQTGGDEAQNQPAQVVIPAGTSIEIRLIQSLGSARSVTGQPFAATLDAPIVVGNTVVVPRGANVRGRVLYAKRSGRLKGPAELSVTLTSLEEGGQYYRIVTSRRSWRGASHKKRDLAWIGGGGAGGSLVGLAAGGGVGAAIGAGVGAGGGTVTAFVTGRKNIVLPSETRLRFVLRGPVSVG